MFEVNSVSICDLDLFPNSHLGWPI